MWRGVRVGAGDQVAPVGVGGARGPDLLAVDDPVAPVRCRPGAQRRDVGTGVGFAHADAPRGGAGDDVGQPAAPLLRRAELQQRGADLAVGEPRGGDRRALGDERLEHDEPLERAAAAAALVDGPGHAEPTDAAASSRENSREVPISQESSAIVAAAAAGCTTDRVRLERTAPRAPDRARSPARQAPRPESGVRTGWPATIQACSESNG